MGQKWIIDVLEDLKTFAQQNDLPVLAEKLQDTTQTALAEIAAETEEASSVACINGTRSGGVPRQSRAC